MSRCNKTYIGV